MENVWLIIHLVMCTFAVILTVLYIVRLTKTDGV